MSYLKRSRRPAGFTLVEMMVSLGAFGVLSAALLTAWASLQGTAVNTSQFAARQNDQIRVIDYLKRDIRRATKIEIYNGTTLVTGTNFGTELQVTVQDYYTDSREEDNSHGPNVPIPPTWSNGAVTYGRTILVKYSALNGAVIRNEAGTIRTIGDATGAYTLSFSTDPSGEIRSRLGYSQYMAGWKGRKLNRQVDVLAGQRTQL